MAIEGYNKKYFEKYVEKYKESKYDIKREDLVLFSLSPTSQDIILDLGCGIGEYSYHILETGAKVVSLDFSYH